MISCSSYRLDPTDGKVVWKGGAEQSEVGGSTGIVNLLGADLPRRPWLIALGCGCSFQSRLYLGPTPLTQLACHGKQAGDPGSRA